MLENTGYHESTSIAMTSTATPSKFLHLFTIDNLQYIQSGSLLKIL